MSDYLVRKFGAFIEPRRTQQCALVDRVFAGVTITALAIAWVISFSASSGLIAAPLVVGGGLFAIAYFSGNLNVMFGSVLANGFLVAVSVELLPDTQLVSVAMSAQMYATLLLFLRIVFSPYTFERKGAKKTKIIRGVMPPGESNYPREYEELG
ncbi:MAG: hypothetical protein KDC26_07045 [Armatimonadetes bacterium]|nr:hypothetical protein [Armatimonadota bacterium]